MEHLEMKKDEIIADFTKGLSISKLAKHYKCAYNTMKKTLIEWGVKEDPKKKKKGKK